MQLDPEWEIWLDCNLSPIIAKWLSDDTNFIVKSSYVLQLYGIEDFEIYQRANNNKTKVIIISKDSDLPRLITRFGSPPKLIFLTIGNCDNRVLYNFIRSNIDEAVKNLIDENTNIVELG